jgi:hypothetical protein
VSGAYKKEKKQILDKLDKLDKRAETTILSSQEVNLKHVLNERLATCTESVEEPPSEFVSDQSFEEQELKFT